MIATTSFNDAATPTAPPLPSRRKKRGRRSASRGETIAALLFISPWMLGLLVVTDISMSYSLILSFTNYDLATNSMSPVGASNYAQLLEEPRVLTSLGNTFTYAVMAVPVELAMAMLMALLLNSVKHGAGLFRVIFFLCAITMPLPEKLPPPPAEACCRHNKRQTVH